MILKSAITISEIYSEVKLQQVKEVCGKFLWGFKEKISISKKVPESKFPPNKYWFCFFFASK